MAKAPAKKTKILSPAAKEKAAAKFDIDAFAKAAGVQPPSARVALRDAKVKKPGKAWVWNTKTDMLRDLKKAGYETSAA